MIDTAGSQIRVGPTLTFLCVIDRYIVVSSRNVMVASYEQNLVITKYKYRYKFLKVMLWKLVIHWFYKI